MHSDRRSCLQNASFCSGPNHIISLPVEQNKLSKIFNNESLAPMPIVHR